MRLEQPRQEELRRRTEEQRKEKARQEATHLIAQTRQMNRQFVNPMAEHFRRDARQQAEGLVRQAEQLLRSDPDQALTLARRSRATMERGMEEASHRMTRWSQAKAAAQEAVTLLRLALDSALHSLAVDNDRGSSQLTPVAHQLAAAQAALRREDFKAAKEQAVTGQEQLCQIGQAHYRQQEQEQVRRENNIVVFGPIKDPGIQREIFRTKLRILEQTLQERYGLQLEVSDACLDWLAARGHHSGNGRDLVNLIENDFTNHLATFLFDRHHQLKPGRVLLAAVSGGHNKIIFELREGNPNDTTP